MDYSALRKKRIHGGFISGNKVKVLQNGEESFPQMLAAIESAQSFILFEVYIFRHDRIGQDFLEAFLNAAHRGIRVYLHLDGFGSMASIAQIRENLFSEKVLKDDISRLTGHCNIVLRIFHPITARWRRLRYFTTRNHRKTLIVDNRIGFLGGINIGEEYYYRNQLEEGFRDTNLQIEGPAVFSLSEKYFDIWRRRDMDASAKKIYRQSKDALAKISFQDRGGSLVKIVGNKLFFKSFVIRAAYRKEIYAAEKSIRIINPYFIPDRLLLLTLFQVRRKGLSVDLMLPKKNDILIAGWAMRHLFTRLLRWDINIWLWPGFIHAKTAVFDERSAIIGSFNWDRLSLLRNLEIIAVIDDTQLAKDMIKSFSEDGSHCIHLCTEQWKGQTIGARILYWLAYTLRWWL